MEDFKDVLMVSQPENLDISLFPHQLSAIKMLEDREKSQEIKIDNNTFVETNVGIYSDITGYGKTLSIIGLILRDKMEWDIKQLYKKIYIQLILFLRKINSYKTYLKRLKKQKSSEKR